MRRRHEEHPSTRVGHDPSPFPHASRSPLVWLLPALPLIAAAFLLASWPIPPTVTGAATPEGDPAPVLNAAFPTSASSEEPDPDWLASRVAPTDELAETNDLLVRAFEAVAAGVATEVPPPSEDSAPAAGPPPQPSPEPHPSPTAAPTAAPTAVPTAAPTAVPTPVPTVAAGPPAAPVNAGVALSTRESLLLAAMNQARAEAGLSPLVPRADVTSVARARSEEMTRLDYFAHFYPGGHSAYELLAAQGISFSAAGENLVMTYGDEAHSVEIGFEALMGSPTHRENILKSVYTRVGVGSYTSDDGVTIITTIFTDR